MIELMTVQEVAKILKVSEVTVRRWLDSGDVRGVKIGGVWRVDGKGIRELFGCSVNENEYK